MAFIAESPRDKCYITNDIKRAPILHLYIKQGKQYNLPLTMLPPMFWRCIFTLYVTWLLFMWRDGVFWRCSVCLTWHRTLQMIRQEWIMIFVLCLITMGGHWYARFTAITDIYEARLPFMEFSVTFICWISSWVKSCPDRYNIILDRKNIRQKAMLQKALLKMNSLVT